MAAGVTYDPIATQTLGSAASTITFSSIPATYTDLRIVWVGTETAANQPYYRFNGDTGTNYSQTEIRGNGTSATSARTTDDIAIFALDNYSTTIPALGTLDVFSYAGSTYKTCLYTTSLDQNGSGYVTRCIAMWRSTSAITSIVIGDLGTTLKAGTTATLYGIKNA
jgi:hypothetical protein